MNTNSLDLSNNILNIIGGYIQRDHERRIDNILNIYLFCNNNITYFNLSFLSLLLIDKAGGNELFFNCCFALLLLLLSYLRF
jgi:hypothetical protein